MSKRRHRARAKSVQKMTRDGLVQENLATGENIRISNRQVEQEFHRSTQPTAAQEVHATSQSSHAQYSASHRARQAVSERSAAANPEPSFHSDHLSYTDRPVTASSQHEPESSHPAFSQEYSSHFQQTAPQTVGMDTARNDAPITRDSASLPYNDVASPRNTPESALNATTDQNQSASPASTSHSRYYSSHTAMRTEQAAPDNSHPSYQQEQISPFQQTETQNSTFVQSESQQNMNGNPNPEPYSSPLNHSPYTAEPVASSTPPATSSHINHYYAAAMEQHNGRRHYTQRKDTEQHFQSQPESSVHAAGNASSSEPASVRDNHIPSNHRTEQTPINRQQSGEQLNFNTVTAETPGVHIDVREPQRSQQFNPVSAQNHDTQRSASSASRPQAQRQSPLQDSHSDTSSVQTTTPTYTTERVVPVQDNDIPVNYRTDHVAVNAQSQNVPLNTTPVSATSHNPHVVVAEAPRQQRFDSAPAQGQNVQRSATGTTRQQMRRQSQLQDFHSAVDTGQSTPTTAPDIVASRVHPQESSIRTQDNGIPVNHRTDHAPINGQSQGMSLNTTPVSVANHDSHVMIAEAPRQQQFNSGSVQNQDTKRSALSASKPQVRSQSPLQDGRSDISSSVQTATPAYAAEHSAPVQDNGIPVNHRTDRTTINGQSQNVPLNATTVSNQSQDIQRPTTGTARQQARRQSQLQDHRPAVDTGQSTPATTPTIVASRVQPQESGIRTQDNGIPVNHRIDSSISPVQETDGRLNLTALSEESNTPATASKASNAPKKQTRLQDRKLATDSELTAPATGKNNSPSAAQKHTPLNADHATPETAAAITPVQKVESGAQASKKPWSTKAVESPAKKAPPAKAKETPAQQSAARDNGIDLNHRQESPISIRSKQGAVQGTPTIAEGEGNPNAAKVAAQKKRQRRLSQEKKGAESLRESSDQDGFSQKKQTAKSPKTAGNKSAARPPSKEEAAAQAAEKKSVTAQEKKKAAKKKKAVQDGEAAKAKKKSKLQFDTEDATGKKGIVGTVKSAGKTTATVALGAAGTVIHGKLHEAEEDNVSVEAVHKAELLSERGVREAKNYHDSRQRSKKRGQQKKASRLQHSATETQAAFHTEELHRKKQDTQKKGMLNKFYQRLRNKQQATQAAKAAKQGAKATKETATATASVAEKAVKAAKEFVTVHKKGIYALIAIVLLLFFMITQLQSCSTIAMQTLGTVTATSWPAEDSEITAAENYYTQLEANLQYKIDTVESRRSGCEEYNYNLGSIGHDPVVLISYLCAKYGDFTFNSTIKSELNALFALQYSYSEEVVNETRTITKTVRVGESLGEVVTSGYCNCSICCGQWAGGPTASGVYPQANHTIAVDASNPIVPIGTKVVMNGVEYTVEDTGNFDQYGVDFDVYYDSHSAASAHGHQTWTAYLSDANGSSEVEVTSTETVKVCYVTLNSESLESIISSRLDDDQTELYEIYTESKGNRQFLGSPVPYYWRYFVSSYYGYRVGTSGSVEMHDGLDISVPEGTEILSVQDGTVTKATYNSSYGYYVVIENDDGYETLYAHCKTLKVSVGDEVSTGDVIATVGSTGNTTGAHLHIEFKYDGTSYNPYFYLADGEGSLYGDAGDVSAYASLLINEAMKYLGTPYVWGGYSPSGFDCSGFVSYAINNCGAGWNFGRLTANGLLSICTPISASEAQPGDLVFFQGTYNTSGASHVGIYLGDGQMIHCGDPCKISSLTTSYWQSHMLTFARLPNP